jgi:hypothetical protein
MPSDVPSLEDRGFLVTAFWPLTPQPLVAFALTAPQVWHGEEELPDTCKNLVSSNNILF